MRFLLRGFFCRCEEVFVVVRDMMEYRVVGIILGVVCFFGEFVVLLLLIFLGRLYGCCFFCKGMYIWYVV